MNFNDNIFNIVHKDIVVFTRYLYVKDEVKIAMLISLLHKNNDVLFWAYELYYSGFKHELFDFIWKIYYQFYATLNPSFESYLLIKYTDWKKSSSNDRDIIIATILNNLLIRPFNTDIFIFKQLHSSYELCDGITEINIINTSKSLNNLNNLFILWIEQCNYKAIGNFILSNVLFNHVDIYNIVLEIMLTNYLLKLNKSNLLEEFTKIVKSNIVSEDILLFVKIMTLFSQLKNKEKCKMYVIPDNFEFVNYYTIQSSKKMHSRKILQNACLCEIDHLKYLNIFNLIRNEMDTSIENIYNNMWLYHASFSPIWMNRILNKNGIIDHNNKQVIFENDDYEEAFYEKYAYEPDEQSCITKNKAIMKIDNIHTINDLLNNNKNGLIVVNSEELNALTEDKLKI